MFVTIHGHFYQPPRENPSTGEVPRQESAAPFHDWNARITDECYGPNGRSRVLDSQGRITAIVNNFAHISFDFGPTLLRDLEERFPEVYHKILEADRESVLHHGGHGNAIAHAYNHMILPLANLQDKWTQVRWGLREFEQRFGRVSEGFWLPETACDVETLSVVAEAGVRFLILSPHQALRWRKLGEREWRQVSPESPIDTTRPYRCFVPDEGTGVQRSLDIFFYDPGLSVAISFEHLLRNADALARRLEETARAAAPKSLIHVATDGEVYGHHEPFGDMCLSFLFHREGPARGLRFVNYAEMLEVNPPEHEVELNFTDTGEGTAWSCAHGIGRWIRDCGCSTGGREGWNQRWRSPLRRGLDAIRDQIQSAFLIHASPHLLNPWTARDEYIEVLLSSDAEVRERFLERQLRAPANAATRQMIWTLLEANHQAMLMYTSCAWFFADISGLEVQQNLGYAARACELAQPYVREPLEPLLLRHLEMARSNLPQFKNGAAVYREWVLPRRIGPEHAGAQAVFEAVELERPLGRPVYRYVVEGELDQGCGHAMECTGRIRVSDPQVEQSWSWGFRVSAGPWEQRSVTLTPAIDPQASLASFSASLRLRDLPAEVREEIARSALRQALQEEAKRIAEIYEDAKVPMHLLDELGLAIPEIHRHLASHVLGSRLGELAPAIHGNPEPLPAAWWEKVEQVLGEMRRLNLSVELGPLCALLAGRVTRLLDSALAERDDRTCLAFVTVAYETLVRADGLRLPLQRTGLEPRAYDLVLRFRHALAEVVPEDSVAGEAADKAVVGVTVAEENVAGETVSGRAFSAAQVHGVVLDGMRALRSLAGHANLRLETILGEAPSAAIDPALLGMGGTTRDAQR